MVLPIKRQITLSDNTTFFVSYLNVVYFDGQRLVDLPYDVNLDLFEKKVKEDNELNALLRAYKDISLLCAVLQIQKVSYESIIEYSIANTKPFGIAEFTAPNNCGVKKERTLHGVEYYTPHFWLEVEDTKNNYGCFVKKLNEAISQIDPSASIHLHQINDLIAIDFNSTNVFMSKKYTLTAVLSFFYNLLYNGVYLENDSPIKTLKDLINVFKEVTEIHNKCSYKIDAFFRIAERVKELADESKYQ